jgi:hypothetical protein
LKFNLRPTISRPVCLGVRRPSGTRNQFFFQIFPSITSCHRLPGNTLPPIFDCCKHDWRGKLPSNSLCLQSYCLAMVGHIVAHSVVITSARCICHNIFRNTLHSSWIWNMPLPIMLSCALARLIYYAANVCIYCILYKSAH